MPSFPKPERGVARYELWEWTWVRVGSGRNVWLIVDSFSAKSGAKAGLKEVTAYRTPAYIYDRKTGEVVATNKEQLESND